MYVILNNIYTLMLINVKRSVNRKNKITSNNFFFIEKNNFLIVLMDNIRYNIR